MAPRTLLGLDLGRPQRVRPPWPPCSESGQDGQGRTRMGRPVFERWPLGTPYPQIVAGVSDIVAELPRPVLVVDGTAVGEASWICSARRRCPSSELISVTITAGHQAAPFDSGDLDGCRRRIW